MYMRIINRTEGMLDSRQQGIMLNVRSVRQFSGKRVFGMQ